MRVAASAVSGPAAAAARAMTWKRSARTTAQVDVQIALIQAATEFERAFVELLKRDDLSLAQYNVLRILRGAGEAGATCGEVGGKMIRHDPDVTRLVDRLERRRLVERTRDTTDRRVVRTRITASGAELLARIDPDIDALHEKQLGHMSPDRLAQLKALVQEARSRSTG